MHAHPEHRDRGPRQGGARTALCCITSYNQFHRALVLAQSVRRRWSEQPDILVLLLDQHDLPRPGAADIPNLTVLTPDDLAIPRFDWLRLKFTAFELACACKPFIVAHALARGYAQAWYCDTDILFLDDPAAMRACAAGQAFVVTPHLLAPLLDREAWVRPTMGHITYAGIFNAGLFIAGAGDAANRFLAQWAEMVTAPAAALEDFGSNAEQHAFNWISAFAEPLAVCRDPGTNVAYWNLHERPIRWAALDGGPADAWLLDGRPICCFHFSGLDWPNRRLSRHDERHGLDRNLNLYHLAAHYQALQEACGAAHYAPHPLPCESHDGVPLPVDVRRQLKRLEVHRPHCRDEIPAWSGTQLAETLLAQPGHLTLLPAMIEEILLRRPDLVALELHEWLYPRRFLGWCLAHLAPEYGDRVPLFHAACVAVHRASRDALLAACAAALPGESREDLARALTGDRIALLKNLQAHGAPASLIDAVFAGDHLVITANPVIGLRLIMDRWPALFQDVPAPQPQDFAATQSQLRAILDAHFDCPPALLSALDRMDPEASLVRVLAAVRRMPTALRYVRENGINAAWLSSLITRAMPALDFDAQDLATLDWWRRGKANAGPRQLVRQALRLLRPPAPPPPAAPAVLAIPAPFFADDTHPARWAGYCHWWARTQGIHRHAAPDPAAPAALDAALSESRWDALGGLDPRLAPEPNGLNIFGYFHSPIGLGQMSRGVATAHAANGHACRRITLTNITMDPATRLADLYPDFGFQFPRSIAITYPHIDYNLGDAFPACFFHNRETIAYIAWEQREMHPEWSHRLAPYDRLFALSRFAAESIARATGRPCAPLPCLVDLDVARARARTRREFDLPEDAFLVGVTFDATSSVDRKNPLAAARALIRAFRGRRDVCLLFKVNNGNRPEYRAVVGTLRALLAESGLAHRIITHVISRADMDGWMAQLDLYVSLHRSEGFGYGIAEAMWLEVPVVATGYSGNMDFMTAENAHPVRFTEGLVRENEGPFQIGTVWADPDEAHAAELCDAVYTNRTAARARAARGAADVRAVTSVAAVAARLKALLG